jgi:riboflavin synthase
LNKRLGGHLVSGHVDAVGQIKYIKKISNSYLIGIYFPYNISKYIAVKGSIAIDGISLTVADINADILDIAVIPHTFENTVLKFKQIGSKVNIEVDMLSRYIERLLLNSNDKLEQKLQELYDSEGF